MGMDLNPEIFGAFAFYSAVLALKVMAMGPMTARHRFGKGVFANPEDTKATKGAKVKYDDPDVERVRRAHLNDLENVLPFFTIGFLYCFTNPALATAKLLFQAFTGARIVHTIVYVMQIPQPSRALSFGVGAFINVYMGFKVLTYFA